MNVSPHANSYRSHGIAGTLDSMDPWPFLISRTWTRAVFLVRPRCTM